MSSIDLSVWDYSKKLQERVKELEAIVSNPSKWMKWCDEKMLERNEELEGRINMAIKELKGHFNNGEQTFVMGRQKAMDNAISILEGKQRDR